MLSNKQCLLGLLIAGSLMGASAANATVTTASSNGYAINATALSLPILTQLPSASGTAPGAYDTGDVVLALPATNIIGLVTVGTTTLSARAASNVDGMSGPNTTYGFGGIDSTSVSLGSVLLGGLTLSADALGSTSSVAGDYGTLVGLGSSQIVDLKLKLGTNVFTLGVGPVAANTSLFSLLPALSPIGSALSLLGINIILNEQSSTCDFVSFCEQETNALHISVKPLGLNTADIILGHSYAMQTAVAAVPEASTYGMMLAGLGLVGAMVARRRNAA
jgi:hypothetical protein